MHSFTKKEEEEWEDNLKLFQEFAEEQGEQGLSLIENLIKYKSNSDLLDEKYKPLVGWVSIQQGHIKVFHEDVTISRLSREQVERLFDAGISCQDESLDDANKQWECDRRGWEVKFDLLRSYKNEFGDCKWNVYWAVTKRENYPLPLLSSILFFFTPSDSNGMSLICFFF